MNINWTEHGHPGNYVVRERTLIKAVNDYLDILNNMSREREREQFQSNLMKQKS